MLIFWGLRVIQKYDESFILFNDKNTLFVSRPNPKYFHSRCYFKLFFFNLQIKIIYQNIVFILTSCRRSRGKSSHSAPISSLGIVFCVEKVWIECREFICGEEGVNQGFKEKSALIIFFDRFLILWSLSCTMYLQNLRLIFGALIIILWPQRIVKP